MKKITKEECDKFIVKGYTYEYCLGGISRKKNVPHIIGVSNQFYLFEDFNEEIPDFIKKELSREYILEHWL